MYHGNDCKGDILKDANLPEMGADGEGRGDAGMSWERRVYERGPPELSEDDLYYLDQAMEKKELERLLEMGVMKKIDDRCHC